MDMKRNTYKWKYVLGFCMLMFLTGCQKKKVETITISIPDYQEEYDILMEIPVELSVEPEGAELGDLEYIADSDAITFSKSVLYIGDLEGTYEIQVCCGDVESNPLTITVVDKMARREAEQKAEEERLAEEQRRAEEAAAQEAEEKRLEEEQKRAEVLAAQEDALAEEEERIAKEAMDAQEEGDDSF